MSENNVNPTINLSLIWTAVASTAIGVLVLFTTFAPRSDIERLETEISAMKSEFTEQVKLLRIQQIKGDIREVRGDLRHESDAPVVLMLTEDLEELKDDLCTLAPDDRMCKAD